MIDDADLALAIVHLQEGISELGDVLIDLRRALHDGNRRGHHQSRAIYHWDKACVLLREEVRPRLVVDAPPEEPPSEGP